MIVGELSRATGSSQSLRSSDDRWEPNPLRAKISDGRLLALIESFLDQTILEELREWTPESGVPQDAVLSPLLSNLYLNELDHRMADLGYEMVRYADDFVVL